MTNTFHLKKAQVTNDLIRPRIVLPTHQVSTKEKRMMFLLATLPFLLFLPLSFHLFTQQGTHAALFGLALISSIFMYIYFSSAAHNQRMRNSLLAHSDEILSTSNIRFKTKKIMTKIGNFDRYTTSRKWVVITAKGIESVIHDPINDLLYISYSDQRFIYATHYENLKRFLDGWIDKSYPFSNANIESFIVLKIPFSKIRSAYVELNDGRSFMVYPNTKGYPVVTEQTHSDFIPST
ncbi:hypothetical protein [Alkalicoccobacillus gibsonii]|uniref:hypothetical protein n=1 Tax=Alkalicoccobacillus gibsonii TaxID=79881 RepID=UPI003510ECAD